MKTIKVVTGSKFETSSLREAIENGWVGKWSYELNEDNQANNRNVEVFTQEGSKIITYWEYQNQIKTRSDYDFIYDDLAQRFFIKDKPSKPSYEWILGRKILQYLANSDIPSPSTHIGPSIDTKPLYVRQSIKRINDKLCNGLILSAGKPGYVFNGEINWMVLVESYE